MCMCVFVCVGGIKCITHGTNRLTFVFLLFVSPSTIFSRIFFESGKILISSFGNRLHALPHVGNTFDNFKSLCTSYSLFLSYVDLKLIRNVLNIQNLSIYGFFTNNNHLMV